MPPDATFWDKIAESYAAQPVVDPAAFDRKIAVTLARMRSTDVVLDVGCGTGSLALRLAPGAGHVHGLDLSSEMVRIANGKAAAAGVENVTFHVGPLDETMPFAPGSLDGVCAYSILHLVEDRPAALAQIHRLLKPGGFFVQSTVAVGESWVPFGLVLPLLRWIGKAPYVQVVDKATLPRELEETGFVDIEEPDLGLKPNIGFLVATKPAA
jgi:arsenite methyltransferase